MFSLGLSGACNRAYNGTMRVGSTGVARDSILAYFQEVALNSEYGSSGGQVVRKWEGNIRMMLKGERVETLEAELDRIIAEINDLIAPLKIERVEDSALANYFVYFGPGSQYALLEPNAADYVANNWGLTWIYWNDTNHIYKGSLYIDIERAREEAARSHLLREELTQSLGLLNDSYRYPESIFYQGWTLTTDFAPIDREIIRLLYVPEIEAGMNAAEVETVFQSMD